MYEPTFHHSKPRAQGRLAYRNPFRTINNCKSKSQNTHKLLLQLFSTESSNATGVYVTEL